jgi:hypothetical protein
MLGLFYCAILWVIGMLVMLYHRSGLQVIGGVIACIGMITLLFNSHIILALCLLIFGFFLHSCGRLLMYLRRRG